MARPDPTTGMTRNSAPSDKRGEFEKLPRRAHHFVGACCHRRLHCLLVLRDIPVPPRAHGDDRLSGLSKW